MALKRVVQLNEGPLDFVRGAARQVVPAVKQTMAAGRQQSALADLTKAITTLVQLVQSQAAQQAQQKPQPQHRQAGQQVQPANTTQQMPLRPQPTFASYLHDTDGDLLNEGSWDFMKGVAKAAPTFAGGVLKHAGQALADRYASDKWLSRTVQAGADAVRNKAGQPADIATQVQQQVDVIRQILQRTQNPQTVFNKVLGKIAPNGPVANRVRALVFQRPQQQQPQAAQQPVRTQAQWSQGQSSGQQVQPRTRGPGNRRPRPTGTQP